LKKNQNESDIDCGGSCPKCSNDKSCRLDTDCQSDFCSFGFCKTKDICSDGKLSPGESDVDCGGVCPTKCSEGKYCEKNENCGTSLECISKKCCKEGDKDCDGIIDEEKPPVLAAKDTDGDGMPDDWEIQHGLNPNDPSDAQLDPDEDGLTNLEEFQTQSIFGRSTDPNKADTDGDSFADKLEIDKKTSPVDAEDFPKSSLMKVLLFILGIGVLLSGFGYLAYRVVQKKKEEEFEFSRQRQTLRALPQTQARQIPIRRSVSDVRLREALKKREEQKEIERRKIFSAFGAEQKELPKEETKEPSEKPELKEAAPEKKPIAEAKKEDKPIEIRTGKEKTAKKTPKKPKEDVFLKLKEIAKESKESKKKKISRRA